LTRAGFGRSGGDGRSATTAASRERPRTDT
jgi:hypothetical protein